MKTILKNKLLLMGVISLSLIIKSCNIDDYESLSPQKEAQILDKIHDEKSLNQVAFSRALSKAVKESVALRKFIKKEALKRFDGDSDILFAAIKNKVVGDRKVRELIAEHLEEGRTIGNIEATNPLLTIFVPQLPKKSFSPETWNASEEIPDVALRLHKIEEVPFFNADGGQYQLPQGGIPSFPVLVVKDNEVLVTNHSYVSRGKVGSDEDVYTEVDGLTYKFAFGNPKKDIAKRGSYFHKDKLDKDVIKAFDIYKKKNRRDRKKGWQRDYIYYGITPTQTEGEFYEDYMEHLTSFQMVTNTTDGKGAHDKIADQRGDGIAYGQTISPSRTWSDGQFDFKVAVFVGSKKVGKVITKGFLVKPEHLFDVEHSIKRVRVKADSWFKPYKMVDIYVVKKIIPKTVKLNIPLFSWDLQNYSSSIKINIIEVDLSETFEYSESITTGFATNFGFSADGGKNVKVGLKFGSKKTYSKTTTFKTTWAKDSDRLGDVVVNFGDRIITKKENEKGEYKVKEYSSGYYKITIAPKYVD